MEPTEVKVTIPNVKVKLTPRNCPTCKGMEFQENVYQCDHCGKLIAGHVV